MADKTERILVMGVGNPLMRDDGIGPRVVEMLLAGYKFPDTVEVVDAGTMSYMILDMFRDIDELVIVDAVRETGLPAGTVMRMTPEEIAPNQMPHSMHDVALIDILQAADLVGTAPHAVCIGVQIDAIEDWVLELSPECEAAVPIATAAVLDELTALGSPGEPNDDADVHAQVIAALRSYAPMPDAMGTPGAAEEPEQV
ncbi:MAG: hydrogenase maturation protease [Coriobacteriia bacterium]|nr:hydrogenase maturation protease [Coriobacteriia bacterium]